jgi:hypothetical protein
MGVGVGPGVEVGRVVAVGVAAGVARPKMIDGDVAVGAGVVGLGRSSVQPVVVTRRSRVRRTDSLLLNILPPMGA